MRISKFSDKDKENLSLSSSGSKQCVRELNLFQKKSNNLKRKEKDNLTHARMGSEKVEVRPVSVGTKEKRMTGRVFKSLIKRRCIKQTLPDIERELEGLDKVSHACADRANVFENVGKLDVGRCGTNIPVLGEANVSLQWMHTKGRCPRNRKRVQYLDRAPGKSDTKIDDVEKKRRRAVVENVDPALVLTELEGHRATEVAGSKEGPSISCSNGMSGESSLSPEVDTSGAEERNAPPDEQKSLHTLLQGEIEKLCQILELSEEVSYTMKRFLEYVILNHHVSRDSPPIMQAFQVSVYWIAASILKQEIDKGKPLILAKQFLNYQCTEEQVESVYSKMGHLKRSYLESSLNTIDSLRDHLSAEEHIDKNTIGTNQQSSIFTSVKMNVEENSTKKGHDGGHILLQQKRAVKDKASASEVDNLINEVHKQCDKRMKKLIRKQLVEIQEFHRIWEEKKSELEKKHQVESALIRYLYRGSAQLESKLELLDGESDKIKEENNLLMEMQLKDLEAKHLAARNEEKEKAAHWLAEAKACCSSELIAVDGAQSLGSDSEDKNPSKIVSMEGIDVKPSDTSISAPAEEAGGDAPIGTPSDLVSTNQQTSDRSLLPVFEQINPPKHFATGETFCANLPDSEERVPDGMRSVELNREVPPEVPESVPGETVDYVNPVKLSNDFNSNRRYDKGDTIGLSDALVSQRDGIDENPTGVLCLASTVLEVSEEMKDSPYLRNEVGVASAERSVLAVAEQLNQPKSFVTGDIIGVNLTAADDSVPDETRSIELIPPQVLEIAHETVDSINPVALSDASNEKYDKGDTIGLPDVLLNQRDRSDETAGGVSCVAGQIVEPSVRTEDSPSLQNEVGLASLERSTMAVVEQLNQSNHLTTGEISGPNLPASGDVVPEMRSHELNNVVPQEVPEDQSHQSLSAELQDQGAKVVEKRNTLPLQVSASELFDTSSVLQSCTILQDQDAPVIENHGTLQTEFTNPPPVASMTAPVQSNIDEQVSENCEQLHLLSNDVNPSCPQSTDIEVENQIHDLRRNSSRTAEVAETELLLQESASRLVENSEIQPNHLDIGYSIGVSHETSVELLPSSQNNMAVSQGAVGTVNILNQPVLPHSVNVGHLGVLVSHPNHQVTSSNSAPVFGRPLQNELERIRKESGQLHRSHKDMISQLRSDCEKEIQEINAQIFNKYEVRLQNAEAEFRLKRNTLEENQKKVFMNNILGEAFSFKFFNTSPGMHQGTQSSFTQYLQNPVRLPHGSSSCQPAPTNSQTVQGLQQLSLSHSAQNIPRTPQNIAASTAQAAQHATVFSSGNMSRPRLVSSATNHQPPPHHLRAFGPTTLPSNSQYPSQQPQHPRPPQFPPPALQYNPEHHQRGPRAMWSQSLTGVDSPGNHFSSSLPGIRSNLGSVGSSSMGQGNRTSFAVASDVVCLYDD